MGDTLTTYHQPADPRSLATILADLHVRSKSPDGKFGFHVPTVHTKNVQSIAFWTDSWCELFTSHFQQILSLAKTGLAWPEFDRLGHIVLEKVIPRLLLPLQADGRTIKPCLVHGDCWDGNTAMTAEGTARFFDVASFYGHNEYDLGDWRPPRHTVSDPAYMIEYKKIVAPSPPGMCCIVHDK
jgi:protein-ribulosamine 3-kinase